MEIIKLILIKFKEDLAELEQQQAQKAIYYRYGSTEFLYCLSFHQLWIIEF